MPKPKSKSKTSHIELLDIAIGGSIFTIAIFFVHRFFNEHISWADLGIGFAFGIWLYGFISSIIAGHQEEFSERMRRMGAPFGLRDNAKSVLVAVMKHIGLTVVGVSFFVGLIILLNWLYFW